MRIEHYVKALDDLTFAQEALQDQLRTATAYEGICLLQILKMNAETRNMVQGMLDAARHEDSFVNLS